MGKNLEGFFEHDKDNDEIKLSKLNSVSNYFRVFQNPVEIIKFRSLYKNKVSGDKSLIALKVKETKNHKLYCRPHTTDAQVLWDTFYRKYHIPPTKLKDNAVIMDLGANVGYTMAHFAFLYPNSKIYGVEMDLSNFLLAQRNISTLTNCKLIHAAVWYKNEEISYSGDQAWGFKIDYEGSTSELKTTVQAKTLDTIFKEFELDEIDYVKMDIEGAEKYILENSKEWIDKIKTLKIEIHPPSTIEESIRILTENGFSCNRDTQHPSGIAAIKNN